MSDLEPQDHIESAAGRRIFNEALKAARAAGKSEPVSYAKAWLAIWKAGYREGADKKWRRPSNVTKITTRKPRKPLPEKLADAAP